MSSKIVVVPLWGLVGLAKQRPYYPKKLFSELRFLQGSGLDVEFVYNHPSQLSVLPADLKEKYPPKQMASREMSSAAVIRQLQRIHKEEHDYSLVIVPPVQETSRQGVEQFRWYKVILAWFLPGYGREGNTHDHVLIQADLQAEVNLVYCHPQEGDPYLTEKLKSLGWLRIKEKENDELEGSDIDLEGHAYTPHHSETSHRASKRLKETQSKVGTAHNETTRSRFT